MKTMDLEQRLYNMRYNHFERRASNIAEFIEKNDIEGIKEHKEKEDKDERVLLIGKYLIATFGVFVSLGVADDITRNPYVFLRTGYQLTCPLAAACLTTHLHYVMKLNKALADKMFKEEILPEKKEIERWKTIGRRAHLGAAILLYTFLIPSMYAYMKHNPRFGPIAVGVMSYAGYHNLYKGYNALYRATADFIVGERKGRKI